jgi:hypothetical protein
VISGDVRDSIKTFINNNLDIASPVELLEFPHERRFVLRVGGWEGNDLSLSVTDIKALSIRDLFATSDKDPYRIRHLLELDVVLGVI